MEKIKFDDIELLSMRQFYEEELDRTVKKLQHIQSVLGKLGIDQTLSPNLTIAPFSSEKPSVTKPTRVRKQKRGPKPFWEDRILKRLTAVGKPLTYEELTDDIMIAFTVPSEDRVKIKQAVNNVVHRLRTDSKKVSTFSLGKREKYIALNKWFDEVGVIKSEFKNLLQKKIVPAPTKAPAIKNAGKTTSSVSNSPRRRGRPAGSKNKAKTETKVVAAKTTSEPKAKKLSPIKPVKSTVKKTTTQKTVTARKPRAKKA
jgi:hypothetical protein